MSENIPQYLTVKAAAQFIERDPSRIYRWIAEGKLPERRVNGQVCVELQDLLSAEAETRANIERKLEKARAAKHNKSGY